jgi:hypothetical protein
MEPGVCQDVPVSKVLRLKCRIVEGLKQRGCTIDH